MHVNARQPISIFWFALQFELALGLAGCIAGWLTGTPPRLVLVERSDGWRHLGFAVAAGIAVAFGLSLLLWVIERLPLGPLRNLRRIVDRVLIPLFRGAHRWELVCISLAAGVGEEILFRAWLQPAIQQWWQWPHADMAAWILAAIAFGICHWVSATYAVLAMLIGLILGWLFSATGHIAAPMVAHSLYDFLALTYLLRAKRRV